MSTHDGLLVATHLSSLINAQSISIPLQTTRQGVPLPPSPQESDVLAEHASYSSVLHTQSTGTVVLRVLHAGLIIELISLSAEIAPLRFVFPSTLLTSPAIFLSDPTELHVITVTSSGSIYRIVIPIGRNRELWRDHVPSIAPYEYLVKNMVDKLEGLAHVQGTHCIAIGMKDGSLLRLESGYNGEENYDDWTESVFQHSSFFASITSLIPSLTSTTHGASTIISIATHAWPTDIGHIWTLSRDRTLRLWKAKIGCVAYKSLTPVVDGRESSPSQASVGKPHLLDPVHQNLIRVFSVDADEEHIYVLVFIPTSSSPSSGGAFQLLDTQGDHIYAIGTIESSSNTARCHLQDFLVTNHTLYTLWDRQGQSMIEKTAVDLGEGELAAASWHTVVYSTEAELTPAYLEELLLSPGSLTDKFLEAIMRPGVFSGLTLCTAIEQYTDAHLSLPGSKPSQLTSAYATIGEQIAAVVGCTVSLNRETETGAFQYANYWNALKRDWEGFIARCREVERSARWPLALGVQDDSEILFVERERIGVIVAEDLPVFLFRELSQGTPLDTQYDLLDALWTLRTQAGPQIVSNLENRLVDILHQEIAFSFADIMVDQTRRSRFMLEIDQGLGSWIIGRLERIDDMDTAIRTILDVIGGFDVEVKREEDEVELLLPPANSNWSRALTASYAISTIEARYELCFTLMILLFLLSSELPNWDPGLLAEVFAVFRGVSMLRLVARQPACEPAVSAQSLSSDDVVSRLRNMNVGHHTSPVAPTCSFIYRLLEQSDSTNKLPGAAHRYLDATGLLQSISPAHTTKFEVTFCERLRLLGCYGTARDLLSWLPRTPGASYVLARIWLNMGRSDDASQLFEKIAGCIGIENALSPEDQEALISVLPASNLFDSQFVFYEHVSSLFKDLLLVHAEIAFARLAISVAPAIDTSALWFNVIKGYIDLAMYDDAYSTLMSCPYAKLKRDCISQLTYRMCEDSAVGLLVSFTFPELAHEVQEALAFKARNADPRLRPCYSKIIYTWFVNRGDYQNAALAMYQWARKLQDLIVDASSFTSLVEEQLEGYTLAINALSLVESKNAWVLLPSSPEFSQMQSRKRRKLSKRIPEDQYTAAKHDAEIVHLSDMQYDFALLSAQVNMIRRDPSLLSSNEFLLSPPLLVMRLAHANQFTSAMSVARSLDVDMTDLFIYLTTQCLRLSRNPQSIIQEDTSDWLLSDKVTSWPGTHADRGWRYLRQSLQRQDSVETDFRYTKAALETILSVDRSSSAPPWLVQKLEKHHHEYLLRLCLRYELFGQAVEHAISLIRKSDSRLARVPPRNASATWLPYTLIDQVLAAAAAQDQPPPRLSELRLELTNRIKRAQKLSHFGK